MKNGTKSLGAVGVAPFKGRCPRDPPYCSRWFGVDLDTTLIPSGPETTDRSSEYTVRVLVDMKVTAEVRIVFFHGSALSVFEEILMQLQVIPLIFALHHPLSRIYRKREKCLYPLFFNLIKYSSEIDRQTETQLTVVDFLEWEFAPKCHIHSLISLCIIESSTKMEKISRKLELLNNCSRWFGVDLDTTLIPSGPETTDRSSEYTVRVLVDMKVKKDILLMKYSTHTPPLVLPLPGLIS
ncbi:hypothetical protein T265_12040 [Opisthorchis viverrini]|uniref:Uncharacterized protein n=1 Tax=Opisthorchis viverrini TaxID=6198 RepID=A0A074YWH4_OPIVI|nr:hypothetical protein T265_12040 [Opisthorchis viverrini]KER19033.1 hypothetical protein T265_12040 [Opisthorchis viverrini]